MAVTFLTNEDGKKFVKSINNVQPDENGNVKITVENPDVDLTGYATEKWVQEGYQPKGEYLTEHQDISGKLDANKLPEAINSALAQAKASGEFDGADGTSGKDGSDGVTPHVGSNGNWFIGEADTGIPATGPAGGQGLPGTPGEDGKDGTSATHSWNGTVLTITSASGTSSADLKGAKGDKGDKGDSIKGDKGDKGDDYVLTDADKAEIAEMAADLVDVPDSGGNVVYDEEQNLTDEQKAQARANIGVDAYIEDVILGGAW